MTIKSEIDAVLNQKMDRRGFIRHLVIGLVALSGISAALRMLGPAKQKDSSDGYGASSYGGKKD